jgi:hypothetical protein
MHVSGKVGNIVYTWLVDTGADVACISAQLPGIDKLAIQTTRSSPVAANGSQLKVVGETIATIKVGQS